MRNLNRRQDYHVRVSAVASVFALILAGCGAAPPAAKVGIAGHTLTTVDIGVTAPDSPLQWWTTMTSSLGFFKKQGIAVQQPLFKAGIIGVQAVLAGSIPFTQGLLNEAVRAHSQGQPLVMVSLFTEAPIWSWVVSSHYKSTIKTVHDLQGHVFGVTAPGSGSDIWTRILLQKNSLNPGKNVSILATGTGQSLAAAMQAGEVVGGLQVEPLVSEGNIKHTTYIIADAVTPGQMQALTGYPRFPSMGLLTTSTYVRTHAAVVQRVVNAYVETLTWMQSHSSAQIAAVAPGVTAKTLGLWTQIVKHVRSGFSRNGMVTPQRASEVIHFLRAANAMGSGRQPVSPSELIDMAFEVKALKSAG